MIKETSDVKEYMALLRKEEYEVAFEQRCNVTFLQGIRLEKSKEQIIRRDWEECSYYAFLSSGKGNDLLFLSSRKYPSAEPNPSKIVC